MRTSLRGQVFKVAGTFAGFLAMGAAIACCVQCNSRVDPADGENGPSSAKEALSASHDAGVLLPRRSGSAADDQLLPQDPSILHTLPEAGASETQRVTPIDGMEGFGKLLKRTAAIVEGTVDDISQEYTEWDGPWIVYRLTRTRTFAGVLDAKEFVVRVRGGRLPSGRVLEIPEMPELAFKKQYILFLSNQHWNYSPFVRGDLVFRREDVLGKKVLVDDTGRSVIDIRGDGVVFGCGLFLSGHDVRRKYEAPLADPATTSVAVSLALEGDQFGSRIGQVIRDVGISPTGEFTPERRSEVPWNPQ